jgi:transposase
VAVDGTGLESRHTSRYFFKRSGRKHTSRLWTKLTVACDTRSHFFAGAAVTTGPSNDAPQFRPVLLQASLAVVWDRVLADAAFDSEAHHTYAREDRGIRSSVIPLNRRNQGRKWPKTTYRRQMVKRFRKKPKGSQHKRVYGQRWQVESAFSRHKRRLGSALGGRSDASREREGHLRVLTHNLMLLAAHG